MSRGAAAAASLIYICASVCGTAAGRGAAAAAADEPGRALVAAARSGDPGALGAEAQRLGATGLARLIRSNDRETRQAALAAAPFAPDAWVLGPALVTAAGEPDRPSSSAAARALAAIAQGLDRDAIETSEAPPDEIAALAKGCAAAARRADLAPDVRVHSLECATLLHDAGVTPDAPAGDLLADPEPEVRRAAASLATGADARALAALVASDKDVAIAATAGGTLCRDPSAALAALSTEARTRLRALAVDPLVEPGAVIGLLPCLRAGGADDRTTIDRLAKKGPRAVQAWLRRK